jgi:hypothetical protein
MCLSNYQEKLLKGGETVLGTLGSCRSTTLPLLQMSRDIAVGSCHECHEVTIFRCHSLAVTGSWPDLARSGHRMSR